MPHSPSPTAEKKTFVAQQSAVALSKSLRQLTNEEYSSARSARGREQRTWGHVPAPSEKLAT